ncbi:2,3,4,5-tetrahydropyridine-2,6-dicarboxylate N-succinyltransferase [Pajaroellobacter abortibovis]|uniref:2,3,4,5-tetrahydropyridine-2,6-dicarboxylate N-succinyltransferase n=1 Tax=Pajaroellobacter abortibovis TaxID=1882918 RepID=A0A1L6MZG3_9BACT|nr:2,3,4,5-tetrahydropyridine-2,6-dicarboxylate N-succinyltransferase [Pajaroellobacter abortibovis]
MAQSEKIQPLIQAVYDDRSLLSDPAYVSAIEQAIALVDLGELRVASPPLYPVGQDNKQRTPWTLRPWVKQAILLYFAIRQMAHIELGPFEYFDKIPLKSGLQQLGVRLVPPGVVRYGAFVEPGAVLMPSYVNIGAWVGAGTMVDTWATVGSCAQVGRECHLSGGVGIGGVLEPVQAEPVIIEDGVFLGSRCVVVEGVHVGREAIIGAGVILTASTLIMDVRESTSFSYRKYIPPRSVVIPGIREKSFPGGTFGVPCALIIGQRNEATDRKVSLNAALREFSVPV